MNDKDMKRLIEEYLNLCYKTHSVPRASEFTASVQRETTTVRRRIRRIYGVPLGRLLRQKRIEKAAYLLRTTDLTVEEVIGQTAPGDRRSFFRAFRTAFQTSPLKYRSSSRTGLAPE
jgi:Transcriptional regulator containing an amidase domain and an AraC-type DNA-binding HTH domain